MGQRRNQAYCKRFSSNMVERYREKLNEKYYQKLLLKKGGGVLQAKNSLEQRALSLPPCAVCHGKQTGEVTRML